LFSHYVDIEKYGWKWRATREGWRMTDCPRGQYNKHPEKDEMMEGFKESD
jgi:hypothetical protein